jgi:2-oxo-3-hexenedioate decarboxylase
VRIADCTADNGLHGRLIAGTPVPLQEVEKLPFVEARLFKAGRLVDRGVGSNVLGSPLTALGFLVDILKKQREAPPLEAGEIITTGVLTDAHAVAPGETWHTELAGMPLHGLEISFQ